MKTPVSDLINAIRPLALVAKSKPRFQYFYDVDKMSFEVGGGNVMVESSNGDCVIRTDFHGKVKAGNGTRITAPARELMAAVRSFPPEASVHLDLRSTAAGFELKVQQQSRASISLDGEPARGAACRSVEPAEVNRVVLPKHELQSALEIDWALGDLKFLPEFYRMLIRFQANQYRAVAGDGSRFVVLERDGININGLDRPFDLQLHRYHTPLLRQLLKSIDGPQVEVTDWEVAGKIVTRMSIGNHVFDLLNNTRVKWPNENKFLARQSPMRIVTAVEDLRRPVLAALATNSEDMKSANRIPVSELLIDTVRSRITLTAGAEVRTVQTVPILDTKVENGSPRKFTFRCVTDYLADMIGRSQPGKYRQLEFIDERAPVVVRCIDQSAVTEDDWIADEAGNGRQRYILFFASYTRLSPPEPSLTPYRPIAAT